MANVVGCSTGEMWSAATKFNVVVDPLFVFLFGARLWMCSMMNTLARAVLHVCTDDLCQQFKKESPVPGQIDTCNEPMSTILDGVLNGIG